MLTKIELTLECIQDFPKLKNALRELSRNIIKKDIENHIGIVDCYILENNITIDKKRYTTLDDVVNDYLNELESYNISNKISIFNNGDISYSIYTEGKQGIITYHFDKVRIDVYKDLWKAKSLSVLNNEIKEGELSYICLYYIINNEEKKVIQQKINQTSKKISSIFEEKKLKIASKKNISSMNNQNDIISIELDSNNEDNFYSHKEFLDEIFVSKQEEEINKKINKSIKIIADILKSVITMSSSSENATSFSAITMYQYQNFITNLYKIDWYIPLWNLPTSLNTHILTLLKILENNKGMATSILQMLDDELFYALQKELCSETQFIDIFSESDLSLYYLYSQGYYSEVVILSLNNINYQLMNILKKHKILSTTNLEQEDLVGRIKNANNSILKILELFFDQQPISKIYSNFEKNDGMYRNDLGDLSLCQKMVNAGIYSENIISEKIALKALFAYKFFKSLNM
ncbi:hypothetical protein [Catellicoccus marimammalium]|uniref:Uncharacterized protein n=1 Tax=Catellicoccus marimammalium M35/04/3 TaxID=1234409 RepID=K8Z9W7_9ENTE|nr:hypothetical protein [Catellicoccus marimammalium]EKU27690.1 hypothetical protein C683_0471 [Catellicoccus marimammalium M35/04/3]